MGKSASVLRLMEESSQAMAIRQALAEHDDPKLILDMIEGETNLDEAVAVVYGEIAEDEILIEGLTAKIKEMTERKSRIERANETRRNLLLMAMERGGLQTVKTPLATISTKATPQALIISDESAIPAQYWKAQDPVLDRKALAQALKDKQSIPGASLSNGGITIQVRAK